MFVVRVGKESILFGKMDHINQLPGVGPGDRYIMPRFSGPDLAPGHLTYKKDLIWSMPFRHKNKANQKVHAIVSWAIPKERLISHISDSMMAMLTTIRWNTNINIYIKAIVVNIPVDINFRSHSGLSFTVHLTPFFLISLIFIFSMNSIMDDIC